MARARRSSRAALVGVIGQQQLADREPVALPDAEADQEGRAFRRPSRARSSRCPGRRGAIAGRPGRAAAPAGRAPAGASRRLPARRPPRPRCRDEHGRRASPPGAPCARWSGRWGGRRGSGRWGRTAEWEAATETLDPVGGSPAGSVDEARSRARRLARSSASVGSIGGDGPETRASSGVTPLARPRVADRLPGPVVMRPVTGRWPPLRRSVEQPGRQLLAGAARLARAARRRPGSRPRRRTTSTSSRRRRAARRAARTAAAPARRHRARPRTGRRPAARRAASAPGRPCRGRAGRSSAGRCATVCIARPAPDERDVQLVAPPARRPRRARAPATRPSCAARSRAGGSCPSRGSRASRACSFL